eukprot:m.39968 g.39968  ORF g.39968 m.39968 type:complete len:400 (-) comp13809_c0_seq1:194-1393(-)
MDDDYLDCETLKKQVAALENGDGLYMDVNTFANSLEQIDNVEDLYICVESLPKAQSKAKTLVETFATEDIYLKPSAATGPGEWHDELAATLKLNKEEWYYGAIPRDKAERLVLDQACGRYLVRVSIRKNSKSYAITVSMGKLQFLHIAVGVTPDNKCVVDGTSFADVREAVKHYTASSYNGIVQLVGPVVPKAMKKASSSVGGALGEAAPPPPPRRRPNPESDVAPPVPPKKGDQPTDYDFNSDHIYASALSEDDDDDSGDDSVYEEPLAGQESTYLNMKAMPKPPPKKPIRSATVKQQPLPGDIKSWTAGEVQRWLKEKKLESFKLPFYANGVDGSTLLDLKGSQFPPKRFPQKERDLFDVAIAKLKKMHTPSRGPTGSSSGAAADDAPPPPPRPSRS